MANKLSNEVHLPSVKKSVSYGLVVEKLVMGKREIVNFVADAPFNVPRVGEFLETSGTSPTLSGAVARVMHNFGYHTAGGSKKVICVARVELQ